MRISFTCPGCQSELDADTKACGTEKTCPKCQRSIRIPYQAIGSGTILGGFELERILGKGGMGEVWLAKQISMDRKAALKIIRSPFMTPGEHRERFIREIKLMARMDHPHIVTAFDAGEDECYLFLAMAYIEGDTLAQRVNKYGIMEEKQALQIIRQVAGALDYAWNNHGLLHRDIKPSNIMLDAWGDAKLVDMGLAKCLYERGDITITEMMMGSPNFISPEQGYGEREIDCRSDIYALGVSIYYLLTAQMPFASSHVMEILMKVATESLPPIRNFNPKVSQACVDLVNKMVAKDREMRHSNWSEVIADIDQVLSGKSIRTAPISDSVLLRLKSELGEAGVQDEVDKEKQDAHEDWRFFSPKRVMAGIVCALGAIGLSIFGFMGTKALLTHWQKPAEQSSLATNLVPVRAGSPREFSKGGARENVTPAATQPALESGLKVTNAIPAVRQMPGSKAAGPPAKIDNWPAAGTVSNFSANLSHVATEGPNERRVDLADLFKPRAVTAGGDTEMNESDRSQYQELLGQVAEDVLKSDFDNATRRIESLRPTKHSAHFDRDTRILQRQVQALAAMDNRIISSFNKDLNRKVNIDFIKGQKSLIIQDVKEGRIKALRQVKEGTVEISFSIDDLTVREKIKRLGDEFMPETSIMQGLLALKAGYPDIAESEFVDADTPLGEALLSVYEKRQANKQKAGVKKSMASGLARKEEKSITAIINNASKPSIEQALLKLRQQDKSLKSTYTVGDDGVTLNIADNSKIKDIQALAGLPLVDLNLSNTRIKEITALRSMSLKKLNLDGTFVKDLSSISNAPLTSLSLVNTPVTVLTPLAGIKTLKELNLNNTPVSNIEDLRGLPLSTLNLQKTLVTNLTPITNMPLEVLNIIGCPIKDYKPLRGLQIRDLLIGNEHFTDLRSITNLPIQSLNVFGPLVKDLSPLAGMTNLILLSVGYSKVDNLKPLRGLALQGLFISGCPVKDVSPLEEMPLKWLAIIGCNGIANLNSLPDYCPLLEELYISPELAKPDFLRRFPRLKYVGMESSKGSIVKQSVDDLCK